MLSVYRCDLLNVDFDEVAIANFGPFQIAVPTLLTPSGLAATMGNLRPARREYSRTGWMVCGDRMVGTLAALELGQTASALGLVQPIRRLAPAIAIAFEVYSHRPLPAAITPMAQFACHLPAAKAPYCTVFRHVSPRFTRVYAVAHWPRWRVVHQVRQLLTAETHFVAAHREQLQQVPFYRDRFGLG